MVKPVALFALVVFSSCSSAFAQTPAQAPPPAATGPCATQSSKLACGILQEYGSGQNSGFSSVLFPVGGHAFHFENDFGTTLEPLTSDIGRQANLLPLASPSSGVVIVYDPSLKTFVTSSDDSLGPILGERAETVGRHRLFIGFSYQFFDFDKIDGVNLHDFPDVLTHTDDSRDNSPSSAPNSILCSSLVTAPSAQNLNGCGFVRDAISTVNSIDLKVNQYTSYITFGITNRIDVSMVIPIANVRMAIASEDQIVPGTNGFIVPTPTSPDATNPNQNLTGTNGPPYFFHLFKNCPNTSPAAGLTGLAAACLNHTFPDPVFTGSGTNPTNSSSGIGDVVARVKWNAWEGERFGFAAGLDVRFPTGDALNYLGSGSYGFKPFAVLSYRARISPHVLIGYEWNTDSITAGDLTTGVKGTVPNDFVYSAGADARVTKWLTGDFDIVGQRVFGTQTVSVASTQFLANCGTCAAEPTPNTVALPTLVTHENSSYNITNASMGIKVRPFSRARLVFTANVLVRLDEGGLGSKAAPLVGVGYTF
jgi:outer membrane putative beta-barrel porin/alpha-amylase